MIPRIIHQIWIGELPPPQEMIDTWRKLNPTWEHRLWTSQCAMVANVRRANEGTIETFHFGANGGTCTLCKGSGEWGGVGESCGTCLGRGTVGGGAWANQAAIDAVPDHAARSDLMRYEILEAFGGVYIDADSECLRPLDEGLREPECWATYENEACRPGIITGAFMGSVPGSSLMRELIRKAPFRDLKGQAGWKSVGPMFLTEVATTHPELAVLPSYLFTPEHYTGNKSVGDEPPYARHRWGNTLGYARFGKVSAVIACKGEAEYLTTAILSLVNQDSRRPDEIVIVCGDDESIAQAESNARVGPIPIVIVRDAGKGPGAARNIGIMAASHPMILLLDADDIAEPTLLERSLQVARGNRPIVTTFMRLFGERDGVKCAGVAALPDPRGMLQENPIGCSALFPKSLWELAGGYDETLPDFEDWDFWLRCGKHRPYVTTIPEPLVRYRQHGQSRMAAVRAQPGRDAQLRAMIRERHPDLYGEVSAASKPVKRHPEELSAMWRPEILGLGSDGILTYFRKLGPELPKGARCVELGVFHGRSLLYLAALLHELGNTSAQLNGIDPFLYYAGSEEITRANAERVLTWQGGPSVVLHPVPGERAAPTFADASLDLVFIDADHNEPAVRADIDTWWPKLKSGGVMAGHDFGHPDLPGVKAAVLAAFSKVDVHPGTVWAVKKVAES